MDQSNNFAYQEAFENSLDAIVCSNKTGLITLWNPAAEQMFGYSAGEALGQPITMLMSAANQKIHRIGFNHLVRTGESRLSGSTVEVSALRKDGSTLPVELSLSSTKTDQGWSFTAILRDISRRKQVEAALADSEVNYRLITELSPDSILIHDRKGKVLFANPACINITSAPDIQSLTGRNIFEFIHPDSAALVKGDLKRRIRAGKSYLAIACRMNRLDGTFIDTQVSATPIHYSGQPAVLVIIQDISERKQAETFVKQTSGILEMIATGQAASGIYDAIALMYEALHPGMRCSMLELKGNTLTHGGAPSLPDAYCNAVNGLQNGPDIGSCGTSTYTGKRVLVKDIATDPKWAELKNVALPHGLRCCWSEPVKSADGTVLGAFGMYYNHPALPNEQELADLESAAALAGIVMERERRAESLHKLSSAIEQAGESIVITDREGVIEYANPAFTSLTGYSAEEAIGQTPRMLKSGNQDASFYKQMWDTITRGQIWHGKVIDRKKDGSFYPATLTISPIFDQSGDITHYTHFVGIQSDLTRLENLEHQFHQAQKMEAIGTLVGGIAHDFNNMLAGITGNLYMIKQRAREMPDVVQKLDNIEEIAFRASDMIQQLLTFARKDRVRVQQIPLNPFIKETLKLLQTSVPENIAVHQEICSEDLQINGDTTQLHQVLLNLINNARDAVERVDHPLITIRLESFQADAAFIASHSYFQEKPYAHLSIKDNGCGIPAHQIEHLFEPFFTTKEQGKGTGLGLAMVFGAIKTHHGFVEVESVEGKGATFNIFIPLLERQELIIPATAQKQEVAEGHGELILLADDEVNILATSQEVLESLGYRVLTATDGQQAVELFKAHAEEIDLIIMDVVMPVLIGSQAAEYIRQIKPQVKIIFATGYDKHSQANMANETVLAKPFSIVEMSHLIRQQLVPEA